MIGPIVSSIFLAFSLPSEEREREERERERRGREEREREERERERRGERSRVAILRENPKI